MTTSDHGWGWQIRLASFLAMGGVIAISGDCAHAQIAPDSTLGAENSVVTPTNIDGLPTERIDGGAVRGTNLFHSFEEFSVPTGGAAYFNNAADIQNIISRVTGESISNIDGLIRANGAANLFLLNPNGIIFGPNARLSIGGSFLGSTASSLNEADGTSFSATTPQTASLLTVSVPLGLQFGATEGSILNQSQATDSSGEAVGLAVEPGKTLALVGGDVRLDGGNLQAPGGRVSLGGSAGSGTIEMNVDSNSLLLSFPEGVARADVYLTRSGSNTARVNVAASNGGSIAITARNIDIAGGSLLRGGLETDLGFKGAEAGDIELSVQGTINVANGFISNYVSSGAMGKGGNIDIQAGSLSVTKGAQLLASTEGQGNAGSVNINARDTVSFDGVSSNGFPSAAASTVEPGAVGNSVGINITTGSLSVMNGAQLSASTSGQGNGGNITINANTMDAVNGGQVLTTSRSSGKAGNINVNIADSVTLSGSDRNYFARPVPAPEYSQVVVSGAGPASRLFASTASTSTAQGGDLRITTGQLIVRDEALVNVSSEGSGNAGNLEIASRDLLLDNRGVLRATTLSGEGGNITLLEQDLILMRRNSEISTSAGGTGNGGNINIDTDFIVAVPGEDSDIIANAFEGNGGKYAGAF